MRSDGGLSAMVAGAAAQERTQVGQLSCDISGGGGLVFGSNESSLESMSASPIPARWCGVSLRRPLDPHARWRGAMAAPRPRRQWGRVSGRTSLSEVLSAPSRCSRYVVAAGVAGIDLHWVR